MAEGAPAGPGRAHLTGPHQQHLGLQHGGAGRLPPCARCPATGARCPRGGRGNGRRCAAIGSAAVTCRWGRCARGASPPLARAEVASGQAAGAAAGPGAGPAGSPLLRPAEPPAAAAVLLLTHSSACGAGGGRSLSGILVVGLPRASPEGAGGVAAPGASPVPAARRLQRPYGFKPDPVCPEGPPAFVSVGRTWQRILLPALFWERRPLGLFAVWKARVRPTDTKHA